METYAPYSDLDRRQFNAFIRQEGHTIEGQRARLSMVQRMIAERREIKERDRRKVLAGERKSEREINEIIRREFQPIHCEFIEVDNHPVALVVEKSSLPRGERADFTTLVNAHVDTIVPRWPSYRAEDQNADVDEATGRMSSVGIWDEGGAAMIAVNLAAELKVPDGMRAYTTFVLGEESPQSTGAKALIDQWGGLGEVDVIITNEIGPLAEESIPAPGDMAMRYVTARPGRARVFTSFEVLDEGRGHASIEGLPNAQKERDRFQVMLEQIFTGENPHGFDYGVGPDKQPLDKLAHSHPVLGNERIDTGKVWYPRDKHAVGDVNADKPGQDVDYVHPDLVHAKSYVRMTTSTVPALMQKLVAVHSHIGGIRDWHRKKIKSKIELFEGEVSYSPFEMPPKESNEAVRVAHEMMTKIAGIEPIPVRGESVADENLLAAALHERLSQDLGADDPHKNPFEGTKAAVISIAPNGNHAHSPNEWMDAEDFLRVRHLMFRLLQDRDGYAQLTKQLA